MIRKLSVAVLVLFILLGFFQSFVHSQGHETSPGEKADLRVGEIVFSIVFCVCVGSIIYLVVKRR